VTPSISFDFGPGRTGFPRGLFGLAAGPAAVAVLLVLGISVIEAVETGGDIALPRPLSGLRTLWGVAQGMFVFTALLGGPTWLILRALRFERGWLYVLAGVGEAVAAALYVSVAFNHAFRPDLIPMFALAGVVGGAIAAVFWMIAREPRPADQ
jgi:uncharacterized membrane protein